MSLDEIINQRTDISNYIIHWTSPRIFWTIIHSGFFISSNSPKPSWDNPQNGFPTIRGGTAVCFSETPIGNYLQSVVARASYALNNIWGIAVPKRALYAYGGRPVLYGNEDFYNRLHEEDKHLFVPFDYYSRGYVVDWAHEREWRTRPNPQINDKIGLASQASFYQAIISEESDIKLTNKLLKGEMLVPIHFPSGEKDTEIQLPQNPQFVILVKTERDKERVKEFIERVLTPKGNFESLYSNIKDYRTQYLLALTKVKIVSLDHARDERDSKGFWRLEDLLDDSRKPLSKNYMAELWTKTTTETRRQVLDLIEAPARTYRAYEYCHWHNLDPQIQQQIGGNEQVIQLLETNLQ